jgi:hypothetical protein
MPRERPDIGREQVDKSPGGRLLRARFDLAVVKGEIESVTFKRTVYVKRQALEDIGNVVPCGNSSLSPETGIRRRASEIFH